jgi:hypothetical protein
MKSGQLLHVTEPIIFQHLPKENNQPDKVNLKEIPEEEMGPPRWTRHIFTHQRQNLKMQYKKPTKLRMKLMRQIRKGLTLRHTKPNLTKNPTPRERQTKKLQLPLSSTEEWGTHTYTQIDLEDAYFLSPLPERLPLKQCVTVFESPPRTTPPVKRRRTLKVRLQTHINNRLRPRPSRQHPNPPTQTIPGTPDIEPEQASTQMTNRETKQEHATEQVEDVELYYRVFNMFRPEQGESNAESAERTLQINKEYALRLKRQRDKTI